LCPPAAAVGTTALKKKGLRLARRVEFHTHSSWNYCPEEEGIKTRITARPASMLGWNYCPEEEGIKTVPAGEPNDDTSWNYCPEEEGIKTFPQGLP